MSSSQVFAFHDLVVCYVWSSLKEGLDPHNFLGTYEQVFWMFLLTLVLGGGSPSWQLSAVGEALFRANSVLSR
jgi:hypothetical protein